MELNAYSVMKVIILGIVEGITEWLPVSSTGHMLLANEFLRLKMTSEFSEVFFVVIQLGAIMAVVQLFFKEMIPVRYVDHTLKPDRNTIVIWMKTAVACIPGAFATIFFDDYIEAHFHTSFVIACMLIIYGIVFIMIEKNKAWQTDEEISFRTAWKIGLFQVLSIIPGTSRSGATIIGALLLGVSRVNAARFTFYLAVPVMFGMSFLKLLKTGFMFDAAELVMMLIAMLTAYVTSLLCVKKFMSYIRQHDFKIFGIYRIILGILILLLQYLNLIPTA